MDQKAKIDKFSTNGNNMFFLFCVEFLKPIYGRDK